MAIWSVTTLYPTDKANRREDNMNEIRSKYRNENENEHETKAEYLCELEIGWDKRAEYEGDVQQWGASVRHNGGVQARNVRAECQTECGRIRIGIQE